eukprot:CAMPEP_0172599862 /NCGR_PEP_ID=MMETSP1068-20121228/19987_1 /TAXON_ID=35684 /ORGANISM="Pseudopedinella elastica, Strain CCMP716" /LENGTH=121 /DNA_ID=CAMNT_0013400265 /DNA_START=246 /DNA_END=611 /DNA_ORIENTATION=+
MKGQVEKKKPLSPKQAKKAKLAKQRSGGGDGIVVSSKPLADQALRVEMARRGDKQVTIIRGLEVGMDERKKILSALKTKIGVGGTLDKASGVVEIQGAHGEVALGFLKKAGFAAAKQSGKK